jgi:hypothetical protein
MATTKITDLTAYTDPVNTDVLPIVDVTSDVTKKVSIANVMKNASLGSNTAPGIAFDGDPNTGIYSPGADQVAVTTGGTQRLLIDSSGAVTIAGDLTVNGTTTNINTTNLVIEDKNIILGDVTTPTDVTADGGGITLKGTTDKTINWVDSTDAWTSSERFSYPLGSAAAPTLTFTGDANTGIYSPGADQVAISTNGTGRLFVDSSGNVGINEASPSTYSAGAGVPGFVLKGNSGSYADRSGALTLLSQDGTTAKTWIYHDTDLYIQSTEATNTRFYTNNTERLRITSTGALNFVGAGTAGSTQAVSFNGSAPVNSLVIDSSGRVGLGTPVPDYEVDIRAAGNSRIKVKNTSVTGETQFHHDGNGDLNVVNTTAGRHIRLFTASTERVRVTSTGLVGIGSTSPSYPLHISSALDASLYIEEPGNNTVRLKAGTSASFIGTTSNHPFYFTTNNTERARIDTSGRLLVGTSSSYGIGSGAEAKLQASDTTSNIHASFTDWSTANSGGIIVLGKAKGGSAGNYTIVANGDILGEIRFAGADGTDLQTNGALIRAEVDGTPGSNDMPGRLVFSTTADGASSPTERMRITNNGLFKFSSDGVYTGIDSNSHGIRQTLTGEWIFDTVNANASSPYGISILYNSASPNGTSNAFLNCEDTTTSRLVIRSNGGIANYSANNVNLSDVNAKKDIAPAAGTWDCLKEWEIVNFRYKDQPDDADLNMGVIAQQVAESCPEVITVFQEATEDQPEKLGVKDQQMMWMAIKALQEAQLRIESLEAEVAALKGA